MVKMKQEDRQKVLEAKRIAKENPRPLIMELGQKITDRIGVKVGLDDPEYWGLYHLVSDEAAEFLLKMDVRKPLTMDQLLTLTDKSQEELEKMLQDLSVIGMLEFNWENQDREKQWVLPRFVPGSAEFMMMNEKQVEEHPILAEFFEQMTRLPLEKVTPMVPLGGSGVGLHVIPVEKAIPAEQESASVEHISHWLQKYEGQYAVGACSCRRQQRVRGEGTGDIEGDLCIGIGDMADYIVETDKGRYIDYDEVIEILERAERKGYVHQITNIDGEDKIFAICNCAPGVCNALRTSQLFNTPNLSRSAYRAKVEKEKCVACGKCVEVCPVGAVKLGQKLCTEEGEIDYPKAILPDDRRWGPHRWDPDYRDKAKINCYDTGTSPCKTACPAHLAVQGYIKLAAEGRYMDALELIKDDNPFPAVCGALCNRRCEDACTRGTLDEAIAIDEIKKFIAEQELHSEKRFIPLCENHEGKFFQEKIAVIGAGPAGMSAAYYLRRMGYPVTIFEKEDKPGGMLVYGVPSFRLEKDVIRAEISVLEAMGIEFRHNVEVGKDISLDQLRQDGYKAFYLAIGAQGGRLPGIPGQEGQGVFTGIEFLRQVNSSQDRNKLTGTTLVVGGGNVAIDVARSAVRSGSGQVHMLSLESEEELPASREELEEAMEENITVDFSWGPKEIVLANGKVEKIIFKKCLSVFDEEGRFAPSFDENQIKEIECENVIFSIGQAIEWGGLLDGSQVELKGNKTAIADPVTYQTQQADIFVGGDVYTGPSFVIDAIAAGKEAAVSINRFVHEGHSLTLGRDLREFKELDKYNIVIEEFDNAKRQIPGHKKGLATETFHDLRSTFTEEQVRIEAQRCLGCGASIVDENKCIGCGLCTTRCEFDAIHLNRDLPKASVMRSTEDKMKGILPYMAKRGVKILLNPDRDK